MATVGTYLDHRKLSESRVAIVSTLPKESRDPMQAAFDRLLRLLKTFDEIAEPYIGGSREIAQRALYYALCEVENPDPDLVSVWAACVEFFGLNLPAQPVPR